MHYTQYCLLSVIMLLLMGCHGDREIRKSDGSSGPMENQVKQPEPVPQAAPIPSPPASIQSPPTAPPAVTGTQGTTGGATAYTEKLGQEGSVDWTAGVVTASGIGYPPANTDNPTQARLLAKRAAQSVAYRNLLEAFKAIRVDSSTTVKNYVTTTDEIEVKVSGMVQGIKELSHRDLEHGGYEVTLQMKLTGEAAGAFVSKDAPIAKRVVADKQKLPSPKAHYTGLVVDARGKGVRPALTPRILNEDGQEAYSQSYVLSAYRHNQGIAAYVSDPAEAKTHMKVTDNPLFVQAVGHAKNSTTDLVISNAAAQTIHGVKDHFEFLEKAQVLVIIDRAEQ